MRNHYCELIFLKFEKIIYDFIFSFWSRELVASSKIKIFGSVYKALAIPILCICPPDNLMPCGPTFVFNLLGKCAINLFKPAILIHS